MSQYYVEPKRSRFAEDYELEEYFSNISLDEVFEKIRNKDFKGILSDAAGLPIKSDTHNLLVDNYDHNSMVIGSTGSGKTRWIVYIYLLTCILKGENLIINDVKGELCSFLLGILNKLGYKVDVLNFRVPMKGGRFNLLERPAKLYKEGKTDRAYDLFWRISNTIFEAVESDKDPFWHLVSSGYFVSLCIVACEICDNYKDVTFKMVSDIHHQGTTSFGGSTILHEFFTDERRNMLAWKYASEAINAPKDTRTSIFSVFETTINRFIMSEEMNDTESGLSTSAVDIEIKEYNQNNEPFSEDGKLVMPGDEIMLIPRINNLGIECYIRAKITYTIDNKNFDVLSYIKGNYSSWKKDGDYYYYNSVLDKEGHVDLFNRIMIPKNLSSAYQGKKVVIHMVVDAIQERNFDGNWNNIEIKKSINRTYDIDYAGESSIIYEDDANLDITLDDNFFGNLGNLLPGDNIRETVIIKNHDSDVKEYFVAIDYGELTDEERKLLRSIKLVIKNSHGKTIASSNLENKGKYSLGIYKHNKGDELTIELSLPADIDNEYSKLFTKIMWRFSSVIVNNHEEPEEESNENSNDNLEENAKDDTNENPSNIPKTGDFKFDLSITVFICSAIGFLVVLLMGKRTEKIEKR